MMVAEECQPKEAMSAARKPSPIPPLENGDRLSRAEFERRYEAMPWLKKAELVEGIVYMPSPVRLRRHGRPHADLLWWMVSYSAATPGVEVADNASIRLDLDNEPQPGASMFTLPECGGQAQIDADDYLVGSPELVGEVSSSTVSIDLGLKRQVYRRNGVREYVVWRVGDDAIDWFVRRDSDFELLIPGTDGILRSECFPGLWLDAAGLRRRDLSAVRKVFEIGLATPEHSNFVKSLAT